MRKMRLRVNHSEDGFTLIELLVVVLVIGILLAVAIPTLLGARSRAQDRQAHSNLRNALTTESAYYTQQDRYTADATELETWEPGLDWSQPDASSGGVVAEALGGIVDPGIDVDGDGGHNCSVSTSNGVTTVSGDCYLDADIVCLVSVSASGTTFLLVRVATGPEAGTYYNEGVACPDDRSDVAGWVRSGW